VRFGMCVCSALCSEGMSKSFDGGLCAVRVFGVTVKRHDDGRGVVVAAVVDGGVCLFVYLCCISASSGLFLSI
jgi:hypothetical protein